MRRIILASGSKARSAILRSCGIRHKVMPSGAREIHIPTKKPWLIVIENAKIKATAVRGRARTGVVLGVDTLVLFKGKLIGEPKDKREAKGILRAFSGRSILVYSGIYVIDTDSGREVSGFDKTLLKIKNIPQKDIEKYFKLLGPYDKAGGFSIEGVGSIIFDDIEGSYYNVLGLPMGKLQELFGKIGLDVLDFVT